MSSSLPEGFTLRRPTAADAAGVAEAAIAMDTALQGFSEYTVADVEDDFEELDLERDAWVVSAGDRVAGYGALFDRGEAGLNADVYVHPDFWRRGIGTALVRTLEEDARRRGAETLRNGVLSADSAARELLRREGYREVRHFIRMRIDLEEPPPPPEWPDGVEASPFDPAAARAFHAALEEAFADEWGFRHQSFEEWRDRRLERRGADPSLWTVVRAGEEIVAGTLCDWKRFGMGWIGGLFVRGPWRRRGIGLALLHRSFGEFYRSGERTVGLAVDAGNPAGATRLYERAGMRVAWRAVFYEKELQSAATL